MGLQLGGLEALVGTPAGEGVAGPLIRALGGTAAESAASGERPLRLEPGRAWTVRSGRIDVFAVVLQDGEPVGSRIHLFRAEVGDALLGAAPGAGLALVGIGAAGTTVAEIDLDGVRALGPAFHPDVAEFLHNWIGHLYEGLSLDGRVPRHRTLELGEQVEVDARGCVRSAERVAWLSQVAGTSLLAGRGAGAVGQGTLLPITREAWVVAAEPSTLRLDDTGALLADAAGSGPERVWAALEELHALVLELVAGQQRAQAAAHAERVRQQQRANQATMAGAISRLAVTVEPGGDRPLIRFRPQDEGEREEDSLVPAFRLVAAAQGIAVDDLHRGHDHLQYKDPIAALARACRVRTRRVALRAGWWKHDNGPLLARLNERKRAVALLPLPGGGYEMVDPFARTQTRVDAAVADTLGPFGHSMYRPFEPDPLTGRDLLRFTMYGCRRDVLTVLAVGLAMAGLGLITPMATATLFNTIIPGAERGQLLQLTLVLVLAAVATAVFHMVRGIALLRIESKGGSALQAAVWDRLLALPLPFFRDYTAGELAVRAMAVEEMRVILSGAAVTVLLGSLFSLTNFGLLFYYDVSLAKVAALLIGVATLASVAIALLQLKSQRAILGLRSRTSGLVLQLLSGIGKLKIAGREVHGFGLWARMFSEQRERQFRNRTLGNLLSVFNAAFPVAATLTLFALAGARVGSTAPDVVPIEMGDLLGFLAAFNMALSATLSSSGALLGALSTIPLYEHIKPILRTTPEVHGGKHNPGELTGAVELQHVTFRYHADGAPVLRDVSIRIRPGEFVAFVGPSGSGKSTTLRLLLGFESPESGSVSYDEQDLAGLDLQAIRRQIGVVVQNAKLMAGDIFTNIVGSSTATLDEAWEAARMAGLDEDIKEMPMGMHTVVSDGGGTLSGGQRQRLMIARALVRRPRLLYFDEATSALDNRTQEIVTRSLDRLKVTRIVVAHRLSTIRNADRIYVIEAGSVVESGTYDELFAHGGAFTQLAQRQLV
jgi:NHLM bacteriocin system ABC transporter ATP-binding protein